MFIDFLLEILASLRLPFIQFSCSLLSVYKQIIKCTFIPSSPGWDFLFICFQFFAPFYCLQASCNVGFVHESRSSREATLLELAEKLIRSFAELFGGKPWQSFVTECTHQPFENNGRGDQYSICKGKCESISNKSMLLCSLGDLFSAAKAFPKICKDIFNDYRRWTWLASRTRGWEKGIMP